MSEPLVVRAMRQFKAQLLLEEKVQMREMGRRWLRVEEALQASLEATSQQIYDMAMAGERIDPDTIFQEERWRRLLAQAQDEFGRYADYADGEITQRQGELARRGIAEAGRAIQLSFGRQVEATFTRLPVEAVEYLVGAAGNGQPVGELLRKRMVRDANGQPLPGVWDRLSQTLINGAARGENPRTTARRMRDDLAGGLTKALQIARTEELRTYREAGRRQYQESGVVVAHKRVAAHGPRTCAACMAVDGERLGLDEPMYDHPQGRCTSVPVVDGMPEVEWLAGEDWLKTQSESVQRSVMGPLYEPWSEGVFGLSDVVQHRNDAVWGRSLTPKSARQLVGG